MTLDPDAIYREHGPALFRYLVRLAGDSDVAEDILHDAFRQLLERPPRRRDNVRGWLFKVATNRFRDLRRKTQRRTHLRVEAGGERALSDPAPSPDRGLAVLDARRTARELLSALPERDRTILLLRAEGCTHREIAQAVGTTTGSVGTMVARALDKVARMLDDAEKHA